MKINLIKKTNIKIKKKTQQLISGALICIISLPAIAAVNNNTNNNSNKKSTWEFIKGSTPENALLLGMLTFHFNPNSLKHDRWSNNLIGGVYKGLFAGTFLNSFNNRAYVFGIQRDVYKTSFSNNIRMNSGYRIGLISGYDSRMGSIAKASPLLPFPEVYTDFKYKHVGIELSWSVAVVTAKFVVTF